MPIQYLVGDVFDRMADMEDHSVDLVLTSPPFLALRSYLPADHPDKAKEIGSEATPAEFVDVLLRLTAEWRRLLTPHGSICIELGDTYSGSGGGGGDYLDGGWREGQQQFAGSGASMKESNAAHWRQKNAWKQASGYDNKRPDQALETRPAVLDVTGWPLAKSLTLIPEAYRFALAYGINPHTGIESPAGQWRVRNVIRWVRPNPPVGALGDKFRPATSELVVAATGKDRWFDLDAVREPHLRPTEAWAGQVPYDKAVSRDGGTGIQNAAGAPPLDWWKISPKGYAGAHYAVWPSELCVKPIQAMCPREVCRECGEPRQRIVGESDRYLVQKEKARSVGWVKADAVDSGANAKQAATVGWGDGTPISRETITLGWSDCGHGNFRNGLVLDPFAGTGTTLAVAHGHGRDAIGIDLDPRNVPLARDRIGPLFLEVVEHGQTRTQGETDRRPLLAEGS